MTTFVDKLIADYAPEPFFTVKLPKGDELKFRNLNDYTEIRALYKKASEFAKGHVKGNLTPELKAVATKDRDVAVMAYIIAELSESPKFSVVDVLKLSKNAALVAHQIASGVSEHLNLESAKSETEEIDEAGEA